MTNIGNGAFGVCFGLTNVVIGDSVISIGDGSFGLCIHLASVTIPDSVVSIGNEAFQYCSDLTNVNLGSSVATIGHDAFSGPTSLTSITIPDSVISIGSYAFFQCPLTNVILGVNVASIGNDAFAWCGNLTSVVIPGSVTNIGTAAFCSCSNLLTIIVDPSNSLFKSVDDVLLDKDGTTLVQCPAGKKGSFTIPNNVTNIQDFAFSFCANLTGIYFQGDAPNIGLDVFVGDNNLTAYYMPGTTGWGDFAQLTGLPMVLWNPQAQSDDASFGVRTNRFGFSITGSSNLVIVVEACTNLTTPLWIPIQYLQLLRHVMATFPKAVTIATSLSPYSQLPRRLFRNFPASSCAATPRKSPARHTVA